MGASFSLCRAEEVPSAFFQCAGDKADVLDHEEDTYLSLESVYPAVSVGLFHISRTRDGIQYVKRDIEIPKRLKQYETSPLRDDTASVEPLSPTKYDQHLVNDASSDTQSVISMVSPTKDRRVASLYLRIPILRPAGLRQPPATFCGPVFDLHAANEEVRENVEKFFDAPMFEAKDALYSSIRSGDLEGVKLAVEQQLPPVLVSRITWPEHHSDTALHLAVRSGHLPIVQYLVTRMGTALNARNEDGDSALSLAGNLRQYEILAYLMRWVAESTRVVVSSSHEESDPCPGGSIVSPFSPFQSSSLQLHEQHHEYVVGRGEEEESTMSTLTKSVAPYIHELPQLSSPHSDKEVDEENVAAYDNHSVIHRGRIFNEDEVMEWLTRLENGEMVDPLATTSETEGDDCQSLSSSLSTLSRLTMANTDPFIASEVLTNCEGQVTNNKRKVPLPRGLRKAAGRAMRQIGRLTATVLLQGNAHQI